MLPRILSVLLAIAFVVSLHAQQKKLTDPWTNDMRPIPGTTTADLAGVWSRSSFSTVDFVNRNTGSHAEPSGEHVEMKFSPDGAYTVGYLMQSSLYNCTTHVFGEKKGVYKVSNTTLAMEDREYVLRSQDNCHASWNYEKHPPLRKYSYQWSLARTQQGIALVLRGPGGNPEVYLREPAK